MIINKSGITIRMKVADLNIIGRATQGVRLINLSELFDNTKTERAKNFFSKVLGS